MTKCKYCGQESLHWSTIPSLRLIDRAGNPHTPAKCAGRRKFVERLTEEAQLKRQRAKLEATMTVRKAMPCDVVSDKERKEIDALARRIAGIPQ